MNIHKTYSSSWKNDEFHNSQV